MQFLDVDIKVNEQDVDTWAWRKPTSTGLFLNFDAICPLKWKSDLIICGITNYDDNTDKHFGEVPYVGAASKRFVKQLSELIKCNFGVDICAIYTTDKFGRYFKLKSASPITLSSNVVYQFLCSCGNEFVL